jgi:hypothetical protein
VPTRSDVLIEGDYSAGGVAVYTVPANQVWIIKSIRRFNSTGTATRWFLDLYAQDGSTRMRLIDETLASLTPLETSTWTVAQPGDQFSVQSYSGLWLWISGARLPYP